MIPGKLYQLIERHISLFDFVDEKYNGFAGYLNENSVVLVVKIMPPDSECGDSLTILTTDGKIYWVCHQPILWNRYWKELQ